MLRITQEAMSNAVRHSGATVMTVNAFTENGTKCLSLADNGSGLAEGVEEQKSGMGLVFMRERAEELPGGTFSIARNQDGGATVRITWEDK